MDIPTLYQHFLNSTGISTDTRKIHPGSMFVALKGANFDANTFAEQALNLGASCVLIDNPDYHIDQRTLLTKDCLATLQALASHHRRQLGIPVIALTGSNGKTTTKELINAVLSKKFKVTATVGNLNNHIGVPLTLLSFTRETRIGLVEMGANHQQEIADLCEIAQPDYGYITNFGKAHLEGFGGIEGVIKGKSEMYQYLRKAKKTVFINLDDPLQLQHAHGIGSVTFGEEHDNTIVRIEDIRANPLVSLTANGTRYQSNLIGIYNAPNISVAIAMGLYFGVPTEDIREAIQNYIPNNNRSQLLDLGTNKIILDAYNANPSSMRAALANFTQLPATGKIAFLGDMFELGQESQYEHTALVDSTDDIRDIQWHFIGTDFYKAKRNSVHQVFHQTYEDAAAFLRNNPVEKSNILIKGSRGMALERLQQVLSENG